MERKGGLADCHPAVPFTCFALILLFTMFLLHPVCLALSLVCALVYALRLTSAREILGTARWLLPMGLTAALVNTLFNSRGATVLAKLPWGYATLESLLYGLAAAVLLWTVSLWFRCASVVLTPDKTVFLFGRRAPSLALLLSMILRFIPQFRRRLTAVREGQRCLGREPSRRTLPQKLRQGAAELSILITWSLDSALDTADSMRARGHGLPGRTSFSVYPLSRRDKLLLLLLGLLGAVVIWGWAAGGFAWRYYPRPGGGKVTPANRVLWGVYALLCLIPIFLDRKEARAWSSSVSTV